MKKMAIAALIVSMMGIAAPVAQAAPCRALPAAGCVGKPDNPMSPDRNGPRSVNQGKKNVNDGKTPAIRR